MTRMTQEEIDDYHFWSGYEDAKNGYTINYNWRDPINHNMAVTDKIYTQDEIQNLLTAIIHLVDDLNWDYDRMSSSGKETLDKLHDLLGIEAP